MKDALILEGIFRLEIWEGVRLLEREEFSNGLITLSINALLDSFRGVAFPGTWYLGLIDNTNFSALSAADSMSSHAGWTENTAYSEATRSQWTAGAAASGIITNPTHVAFTATSDIVIRGLFVTSNSTKGGATGTLWSHGTVSNPKQVSVGQQLKGFYELRGRQG